MINLNFTTDLVLYTLARYSGTHPTVPFFEHLNSGMDFSKCFTKYYDYIHYHFEMKYEFELLKNYKIKLDQGKAVLIDMFDEQKSYDINKIIDITDLYSSAEIDQLLDTLNSMEIESDSSLQLGTLIIPRKGLKLSFLDFIKLKKLYPTVYISFAELFLNIFEPSLKAIQIKSDFEYLKKKYSQGAKLFELLNNQERILNEAYVSAEFAKIPQYYFDISDFPFPVLDHKKTLIELCNLIDNSFEYEYDVLFRPTDEMYILYKLEYIKQFKKSLELENIDYKNATLDQIKRKDPDLIQFLKSKKFDDHSINYIINILSFNQFSSVVKVKDINIGASNFYRILYSFYILDYYFEKFSLVSLSETILKEEILGLHPRNSLLYKLNFSNEIVKYHKATLIGDTNSKNYKLKPSVMDKFYKDIENTLFIKRDKLKSIPESYIN